MKIKNIVNPKAFFEKLNECNGSITLVTNDGDTLNLKSKLCQYIAMMDWFSDAKIGEMELLFSEPEDFGKVVGFLVRGE